ncbi:MAG: regulatory protein [Planctomycetota bacterium]|nr:MAG: regulatory protein [Planctomycetota bacterium]
MATRRPAHTPSPRVLRDAERIFSALADRTRLRLLCALMRKRESRVTDLAASLGCSLSALSHQLSKLRDRRIVAARRDGRVVWYALSDAHVATVLKQGLRHAEHP